jgi:hypothetical protein
MTPRTLFVASAVALFMLAGSVPARAQNQFVFDLPFSFIANGRTFTAGQYTLVPNDQQDVLTLTGKDPKAGGVLLPVETRISGSDRVSDTEIVFDKLNGKLYVSELLVPGEDGYVFLVTKAQHTHQSVKGVRGKK